MRKKAGTKGAGAGAAGAGEGGPPPLTGRASSKSPLGVLEAALHRLGRGRGLKVSRVQVMISLPLSTANQLDTLTQRDGGRTRSRVVQDLIESAARN